MTESTTFKILFLNAGYYTGLNGSLIDYIFRSFRYFYLSKKNLQKTLEKVRSLLCSEKPDICCLVEIPDGRASETFAGFPHQCIENKYGQKSLLRHIPFFHYRCNGVFAKTNFPVYKHFLTAGIKKLVLEVDLGAETSLFIIHASLSRLVRKKQLVELTHLLQIKRNIILCGDFNVFSAEDSFLEFTRKNSLTVVNLQDEKTFPSHRPRRTLDLFLCSNGIRVNNIKTLYRAGISDHVPIMLEIKRQKAVPY